MGNLTLLGGLRGTKLELKRALGAAKRAPRRSKSVPALIDGTPTGVILGPDAPPKVRRASGQRRRRSQDSSPPVLPVL